MDTPREIEKAVTLSYWLLAISSGLTLLQFPFDPRIRSIPNAFPLLVFLLLITICLTLLLIFKIKSRRNWARITLLVILCVSAPGMAKSLIDAFKIVPFFGLAFTVLTGAEIYCLTLLFSAPANRWFSEYQKQIESQEYSFAEAEARRRMIGIYEKEKWENK